MNPGYWEKLPATLSGRPRCAQTGCTRSALPGYSVCQDHLTYLLRAAFGPESKSRAVVRRLSAEDPTLQIVGRRGQS